MKNKAKTFTLSYPEQRGLVAEGEIKRIGGKDNYRLTKVSGMSRGNGYESYNKMMLDVEHRLKIMPIYQDDQQHKTGESREGEE